jgi:quercetin dioxygenase-like cupin family protein
MSILPDVQSDAERGQSSANDPATISPAGSSLPITNPVVETLLSTIAPGGRLVRHTDTVEETQFIHKGSGELRLDEGTRPMAAGDVAVL